MKLTAKLVLLLSLATFGVLGAYGFIEIKTRERDLNAELTAFHRLVVGNALPPLSNALWNLDTVMVKSAVLPFFGSDSIKRTTVYTAQGDPFLTFNRNSSGKLQEVGLKNSELVRMQDLDAKITKESDSEKPQYAESEIENVGQPIALNSSTRWMQAVLWFSRNGKPENIGRVVIEFSTDQLEKKIVSLRLRMVIMSAALAISILLILFVFLELSVIRRILRLKDASIKVAAGVWETVPNSRGEDELNNLSENFNAMVNKLSADVHDIEEKNRQLIQLAELLRDFSSCNDIARVLAMLEQKLVDFGALETIAIITMNKENVALHSSRGFSADYFQSQELDLIKNHFFSLHPPALTAFQQKDQRIVALARGLDDHWVFVVTPHSAQTSSDGEKTIFVKAILESAQRAIMLLDGVSERARIDGEIEAATIIHNTLLPKAHVIPGFEFAVYSKAATHLGGDWFGHYYDQARQRFYCLVGDVTGHGIGSALVAGVACGGATAIIRRIISSNPDKIRSGEEDLREIANTINGILFTTSNSASHVMTMLFCCLDGKNNEASFLNCAHPHPIFLKNGGHSKAVPLLGCSLGFRETLQAESRTFPLEEGEGILLYTDGLLENTSTEGRVIPRQLLKQITAKEREPRKIVDIILESANNVWGDHPLDDDVTIFSVIKTGAQYAE